VHLEDLYTGKPDGSLTVADTGQTWEHAYSSAAAQLRLVGGKLVNTTTATSQPAGYIDTRLDQKVLRLGARFSYGAGSTGDGAAVLVAWRTSITSFPTIPDAPFHWAIWPAGWELGVIVSNVFSSVASGSFASPLATDGTVYRASAFINGATVTLSLPDATSQTVTDSRFAAPGQYAGFEIYYNNASTAARPQLVQLWAADEDAPRPVVQVDFATDLAASVAYSEQVLASAPYAYHLLRETSGTALADATGNGRSITASGTVTLNQTSGKPVTGETASRYVTLGANADLLFAGAATENVTVEAFVYQGALSGSGATQYVVFTNGGTFAAKSLLRLYVDGLGKIIGSFGNVQFESNAGVVVAATWYHVAVSFDAANRAAQIYLNGAAITTTVTSSPSAWSLAQVLTSWRWGGGSAVTSVDRLGEPTVYTRAVAAAEISDHYAARLLPPFAGYSWTDVTPYLLFAAGLRRRFGRESQLDEVTPMTVEYTLRNDDRRFEAGYLGDVANLAANPSFETSLSYWADDGSFTGVTRTLSGGSYRMTGFAATTTPYFYYAATWYSGKGIRLDVTGGDTVALSARAIRATRTGTVRVTAQFRDANDNVISAPSVDTASVADQRVSGTFTVPDGAEVVLAIFMFLGSVVGDGCAVDDFRAVKGTATTYVDGSTGGYAWTGAAGLSQTVTPAPYAGMIEGGRPTRVQMMHDGNAYDWAFGFVEDWPQVWDRAVLFGEVPVRAACFLERLNQENIGTRVFSAQQAGGRITAILNAAGHPASMRAIAPGAGTVMGGTFENVSAGDHARQAARTDRGLVFFDGRGYAVFHDGNRRGDGVTNPSAAVDVSGWSGFDSTNLFTPTRVVDASPAAATAFEVAATPASANNIVLFPVTLGTNMKAVRQGDIVNLQAWVKMVSGATSAQLYARVLDASGTLVTQTFVAQSVAAGWNHLTAQYTVPAGVAWVAPQIVFVGTIGVAITGRATEIHAVPTVRGVLGSAVGEIPYWEPDFHTPLSMVRNDITIRRPGGVDQPAVDPASQRKRGKRSYSDELLLVDDTAAAVRAALLLSVYKDPQTRVRSVTFNPAAQPGFWPHALGVQISDRYGWQFRPRAGTPVNRDVFVEGVEDEWRSSEYVSKWALSVA
jgi:hypothetical protein